MTVWTVSFRSRTAVLGAGSGLGGATECMPALHQLLGLAKHLVPVLQLSTTCVHVGTHHHAAQRVAPCRERELHLFLSTEVTSLTLPNIPSDFSKSVSYSPLKEAASPLLSKHELSAPKGVLPLFWG